MHKHKWKMDTHEPFAHCYECNADMWKDEIERYLNADLLKALEEIAEGKGVYSLDKFTHATNVIENLTTIAKQAISKAKETE